MPTILKKTDLAEVRNANMRFVKDRGNTSADIARASRIVIQLRQLEIKAEESREIPIRPAQAHREPEEVIVSNFGHLKIVR